MSLEMAPNDLSLDAYIRVSKVAGRSGESFISPDGPARAHRVLGQAHGHTLTWHEPELDVSGGTMSRPIFDRIMERIRAGQTDGVIVAKLDRFARTLVGALSTLEEFERHGAVLVSVADNIDLSTPMGKAFLRILLVFAELERDRIKRIVGDGTLQRDRPWHPHRQVHARSATTRVPTNGWCPTARRPRSARRS